jgi:3-oxoacyl-[acyl-carrier-protein] synthase III
MAAQAIRSGSIKNALVVGTETLSRFVNWKDRNTCILFGDGAGAFVIQASERPGGILSAVMHSDGSGADSLTFQAEARVIPPLKPACMKASISSTWMARKSSVLPHA